MQKWEYLLVPLVNKDKNAIAQHLNYLGDQGWELVSIVPTYIHGVIPPGTRGILSHVHNYDEVEHLDAYFRRPKP
jgi:hypothetical protein